MSTDAHATSHDSGHEPGHEPSHEMGPHEHEHPAPSQYIKVAVFLAIVTAIEVGAYYVSGIPDGVLSAALIIMMLIKFAFVGLWFMHLRFDSPLFRRLFIVGIVLAIMVYTVVLVSFGLLIPDDQTRGGFGDQADPPAATVPP